jgi:hypothetical protein
MNNDSCLRMEALLRSHAAELGAPDLGDENLFEEGRLEDGSRRLLPPRARLLARIDALERHVLLLHRGVYEEAMAKIQASVQGTSRGTVRDDRMEDLPQSGPTGAIAMIPSPTNEGRMAFNLADLPDLALPLKKIRTLRARIMEDPDARPQ